MSNKVSMTLDFKKTLNVAVRMNNLNITVFVRGKVQT